MKFRAAWDGSDQQASDDTAITIPGKSMTIQSMTEDSDINVLMTRYGLTGKFPENPRIPQYGDFTDLTDYRGALEAVATANEYFIQYPPAFRARFENDPQQFMEWCNNPANRAEMKQLGLLKPEAQSGNTETDRGSSQAGTGLPTGRNDAGRAPEGASAAPAQRAGGGG